GWIRSGSEYQRRRSISNSQYWKRGIRRPFEIHRNFGRVLEEKSNSRNAATASRRCARHGGRRGRFQEESGLQTGRSSSSWCSAFRGLVSELLRCSKQPRRILVSTEKFSARPGRKHLL